ncbi:MAG: D-sedoheptulose 7-phosphate isomerase [Flavobacteriales bacterium]|nr:D-sedoheptulose 7-phosphate isomerase [Flavobacteriales bacterium]
MSEQQIIRELREASDVLERFIGETGNIQAIAAAAQLLSDAAKDGQHIYSCGNGGSMSDAMHFAEELSGRFRNDRPPIAAAAISDPGHITCTANDYGFSHVFSRYVEAFGKYGDVLLAISTSGNSENVLNAAKMARDKGMKVIALTGKDGGRLAGLCDVEVRAPHSEYSDRVQEIHIKVIHILVMLVEQHVFEKR